MTLSFRDTVSNPHEAMGQAGPDYDNLTFHEGEHPLYPAESEFHTVFAHHPEHGDVGRLTYRVTDHPAWTGFESPTVHLTMLHVDPDHTRRGVASQLMDHVTKHMFKDTLVDHGDRLPEGEAWSRSHYNDAKGGGDPRYDGQYSGGKFQYTKNGRPWNIETQKHYRMPKRADMDGLDDALPHRYPPIHKSDLSTDDARRSREVSHEEFQGIADRGRRRYERLLRNRQTTEGLHNNWDEVKRHAFHSTREPWGGATYNTRTGKPIQSQADIYAVSARPEGAKKISVRPDAPEHEFHKAMDHARDTYSDLLSRRSHHLGVFHDADQHRVDIDPVVLLNNTKEVEEVGAYKHSVGGAYHFKSGDGYWPPHVRDEEPTEPIRTQGSLAHRLFGRGLDALFRPDEDGPALEARSPFPQAAQRKDQHSYDRDLVTRSITHPHEFKMGEVDPRELHATQPKVVRHIVKHYMEGGETSDPALGNDTPRVYHRDDGEKIILTGHHRAVSALLKGEPLNAMHIHGGWGAPRKTAMGQAGPDYNNLSFDHMTGYEYGLPSERHDEQLLFAKHPDHGYVGHIHYLHHGPELEIQNLSVHGEHQRRGVASQLMAELERRNPDKVIDHGLRTQNGGGWARSYYGHPGEPHGDLIRGEPTFRAPKTRGGKPVTAGRQTDPAKLTDRHIQNIRQMVHQVRSDECHGGQCGFTSENLTRQHGWPMHGGIYHTPDGKPIGDHVWNVHEPSGTIIDSTADQFGEGHDVRVLPPNHPDHSRYRYAESDEHEEQLLDQARKTTTKRGDYWWVPGGKKNPHVRAYTDKERRYRDGEPFKLDAVRKTAADWHESGFDEARSGFRLGHFSPKLRVFTHTCGLDHRLWDANEKLKPEVRSYIMSSVSEMWGPIYKDWSEWAIVYFAGSEASEWTSEDLEGNNDFDVLIGVDYDRFRKANPLYEHLSNIEITNEMNEGFRQFNGPVMLTIGGTSYGPFDRTTYVNPNILRDIHAIKPYAAYSVSQDRWVVRPPHLPHWGLSELPGAVQKVLRATDTLARNTLKLDEPERTQQGAALFDAWHSDRSRAFGPNGEGWWDIANLREKWLDQAGLWAQIVDCKHRFDQGLGAATPDWSNMPKTATLKMMRPSEVLRTHTPTRDDLDAPHMQHKMQELRNSIMNNGYVHGWGAAPDIQVGHDPDRGPTIVDGHKRLKALDDLGFDWPVPVKTGAVDKSVWYHGTSAEHAQNIIENGARKGLNVITFIPHANNYARLQARFHSPSGRGVVLEGHLDGTEEDHPWERDRDGKARRGIAVTSRPNAFVPTHWHEVLPWERGEEPIGKRHPISEPIHKTEGAVKQGMAWFDDGTVNRPRPKSVRRAGFKGFVTGTKWMSGLKHDSPEAEIPDHVDDHLMHFIGAHSGHWSTWDRNGEHKSVDLTRGVYATQSHVAQYHIDRYRRNPRATPWAMQDDPDPVHTDDYPGHYSALFVTHQNRLHAAEGHHRVGAKLQEHADSTMGFHYDLDRHPIVHNSNGDPCPTCESFTKK